MNRINKINLKGIEYDLGGGSSETAVQIIERTVDFSAITEESELVSALNLTSDDYAQLVEGHTWLHVYWENFPHSLIDGASTCFQPVLHDGYFIQSRPLVHEVLLQGNLGNTPLVLVITKGATDESDDGYEYTANIISGWNAITNTLTLFLSNNFLATEISVGDNIMTLDAARYDILNSINTICYQQSGPDGFDEEVVAICNKTSAHRNAPYVYTMVDHNNNTYVLTIDAAKQLSITKKSTPNIQVVEVDDETVDLIIS